MSDKIINIASLKRASQPELAGLIAPATEEVEEAALQDHSAQPIKSLADIERISDYLIENERYRDNMMFIVGINFGLRVSDLRMLRFSNLINPDSTFKESFAVFEKKTRNTRKKKKNRYITINRAVKEAVTLYLEHAPTTADGSPTISMSDYLFASQSTNGLGDGPLSARSFERILKGIAEDLSLDIHMSTHTLRKTFAYWTLVLGKNDQRQLYLLQKMFNHSSPQQTLAYIGLDRDEIAEAYKNLNLGAKEKARSVIENSAIRFEIA